MELFWRTLWTEKKTRSVDGNPPILHSAKLTNTKKATIFLRNLSTHSSRSAAGFYCNPFVDEVDHFHLFAIFSEWRRIDPLPKRISVKSYSPFRLSIFQIKFNEVHRICLSYGKQSANFDIDEPWGSLPNAIEVEKLSKSQDRNVSEKERTKENPVKSTAKFRKNNRLKENKPSEAECLPTFTVPVHCNASTKIKIDPVEEKKGKIGLSTDMFPHSKKDEVKEEEEWEKNNNNGKRRPNEAKETGKKGDNNKMAAAVATCCIHSVHLPVIIVAGRFAAICFFLILAIDLFA